MRQKKLVLASMLLALGASAGGQSVMKGKTSAGIAYDVQGAGPVVILISGSNLDRRMWDREAQWLARTHTVVRYDLRAHGESDTATEPFSHLGDLVGVRDALQIDKATLIGLSAGSTIALDAALAFPNRVERLVLIGPAISGFAPKQRPPFVDDMMAALQARDYNKVSEVLLATPVFAAPPESQALVRRMVTENERLWTVDPALIKGSLVPAVNRLEQVRVPTLILIGERDDLQREQAELLAKRVPRAKLVRVRGGGHLLNLTSPAEFENAVTAFLSKK